jgi:phosphoribosylanthranilate isomerase
MKVAIKICGLRRPEDVDACVQLAVDLVGFNFWPGSKRYLTAAQAVPLARRLPRTVRAVGVFVDEAPDEVARVADEVGLAAVQLHGDRPVEDYARVPVPLVQVIRVVGAASLSSAHVSARAAQVLLDAAVPGFGGAGARFDWTLAQAAVPRLGREVLLAGGLDPANVAEAIGRVRPWGVDVATGVESAPGEKDPALLARFVAAVRQAEAALAQEEA